MENIYGQTKLNIQENGIKIKCTVMELLETLKIKFYKECGQIINILVYKIWKILALKKKILCDFVIINQIIINNNNFYKIFTI